jgi:glucose/arabinose dehydrogenase
MNRALLSVVLVGCSGGGSGEPAAPVRVDLEVPAFAATAPFDVPHTMMVPPGFGIRVVARVDKARFLALTPEGDLLVSRPSAGEVVRISDLGATPMSTTIASGLTLPHDMVFADVGGTKYLYLSEHDRVSRAPWVDGAPGTMQVVVGNLPSASLPELHGNYGHGLKNIAIDGQRLFISIASATNADVSDIQADPVRGAIYVYDVDGGGGRLYAKGLRNAEGLAIHPRTGELWVAVNHRDNVRYPLHDGLYPYGAEGVYPYIDDNPPEPFTRVRDGGNYGWPYCNPTGGSDSPFVPDYENNPDESVIPCGPLDRIDKALPAHSAPLGMSFWTGESVPAEYRDGAVVGMHGCWNCTVPHGYKVGFLRLRADNGFDDVRDLVTGFLANPDDKATVWGRPVDVIPNAAGNLYISDDLAGAVYELYRTN